MLTNHSKWFTGGCLLLGILFCVVGVVSISWYKQSTECFKDRPPLESLDVIIEASQSQQLIAQLQKFADKNGFQSQVSYYTPNGEDFSVWMERKDVEVIANNTPSNLRKFNVGFYNNDCFHPTVASDIAGLVSDLKGFLGEIPNATITEGK